ncbi:MAG TPA: rhomboid family intramembrane serine protease [Ktedonobacterales bacterium]|jgi:rhomboid protease GluP
MDAASEAETYLAQGRTRLWQGQAQEAAAAFAQAIQLAPDLPAAHLGQAQADLALGSYGLVQMACRRVQELALEGPEAALANALLCVLDHRYDRALEAAEQAIAANSSQPYAHALRGYCLRQLGREYEAALAEARAARMAGDTDFHLLFPQATPAAQTSDTLAAPAEPDQSRRSQPAWRPPSQMQRRVIQFRFATRHLALATLTLIAINLVVFVVDSLSYDVFVQSLGFGLLILQGEVWRLGTAIFFNFGIVDLLINMLWLYIIGRWVEQLYGAARFWLLYLGAGIFGGLLTLVVAQNAALVGAATAVLGVFGALGAFLWHKGSGAGLTLRSWLFWLVLNLVLTFAFATLWLPTEIGGLAAGLLIGLLLLPDFWQPVRLRLKRGQRTAAINYAMRPIFLTLVVDAGLLLFALLLIRGAGG